MLNRCFFLTEQETADKNTQEGTPERVNACWGMGIGGVFPADIELILVICPYKIYPKSKSPSWHITKKNDIVFWKILLKNYKVIHFSPIHYTDLDFIRLTICQVILEMILLHTEVHKWDNIYPLMKKYLHIKDSND